MKTIAYLRVSKDTQDVKQQRLAILEFARQERLEIDEFMELSVSSRRSPQARQLDVLLGKLEAGDTLVVSELSRMGLGLRFQIDLDHHHHIEQLGKLLVP